MATITEILNPIDKGDLKTELYVKRFLHFASGAKGWVRSPTREEMRKIIEKYRTRGGKIKFDRLLKEIKMNLQNPNLTKRGFTEQIYQEYVNAADKVRKYFESIDFNLYDFDPRMPHIRAIRKFQDPSIEPDY
ncbi:hypothetical protein HYW76_04505 [Candidatus Pacearchaeota archaeon]|nr:hypothetical protein [Candidatus Pacearchaeota archaeon]